MLSPANGRWQRFSAKARTLPNFGVSVCSISLFGVRWLDTALDRVTGVPSKAVSSHRTPKSDPALMERTLNPCAESVRCHLDHASEDLHERNWSARTAIPTSM